MENKKVYDFIKGNFINLIVILTSVAYVFYNMVVIEKTDLSMAEVIAKAGLGIIIGFMIKQALSENGFNYGYRSGIWKEQMEKYSNACNMANPYIERVDNFYCAEEIGKKKNYRRTNMMAARMRYEWFFDAKGNYIHRNVKTAKKEYESGIRDDGTVFLTRHQKKILKKCIGIKVYNLNLFSEYGNEIASDVKKEKTDASQRSKMFGKNGLSAVITAVVGAYFVPMLDGWSWASFIAASVQVCIWICCGITQMYTNYNYVVIEKTNKITRKMELIIKFKKGCENGMYLTNPYEEEHDGKTEICSPADGVRGSSVCGSGGVPDSQVQPVRGDGNGGNGDKDGKNDENRPAGSVRTADIPDNGRGAGMVLAPGTQN